MVADRASKAPFDPAFGLPNAIKLAGMQEGLMCYPMGGTIDGRHGGHILLAPPFILTEAQVEEITDKLGRALEQALKRAA